LKALVAGDEEYYEMVTMRVWPNNVDVFCVNVDSHVFMLQLWWHGPATQSDGRVGAVIEVTVR
jgi:hypothetical protein